MEICQGTRAYLLHRGLRHPEDLSLHKPTSKAIAKELFLLFSQMGIPSEVLTDHGTLFKSELVSDLSHLVFVPSPNRRTGRIVQPDLEKVPTMSVGRGQADCEFILLYVYILFYILITFHILSTVNDFRLIS